MSEPFSKTVQFWLLFFLGTLMLIAGLFLLPISIIGHLNADYTSEWPMARGIVTQSFVEESNIPHKYRGVEPYFKPRVEYSYLVEDEIFNSDQIAANGEDGSVDRQWAQDVVARYPTGSEIEVFYDPQSPGQTVLEKGVPGNSQLLFLMTGILLTFGFGITACGIYLWTTQNRKATILQEYERSRRAAEKSMDEPELETSTSDAM